MQNRGQYAGASELIKNRLTSSPLNKEKRSLSEVACTQRYLLNEALLSSASCHFSDNTPHFLVRSFRELMMHQSYEHLGQSSL